MSKAAPARINPQLGDRHPDKPGYFWALCTSEEDCPMFPEGRWAHPESPRRLKAAGYKQRCPTCAQKEQRTSGLQQHNEENIPLGTHHPYNQNQIWVGCSLKTSPLCHGERWASVKSPRKIIAAGAVTPCPACANDARGKHLPVKVPTGSIYHYEMPRVGQNVRAECGICNFGRSANELPLLHDEAPHYNHKNPTGFCEDCTPWARLALLPEHYEGPSEERRAIYNQIKRIKATLAEAEQRPPEDGSQHVPFCVAAQAWLKADLEVGESALLARHYFVRRLSLYFGDLPISMMRTERVIALRAAVRDALTKPSVDRLVTTLRSICYYAVQHSWASGVPIPPWGTLRAPDESPITKIGGALIKTPRLLSVSQETKLLAACVGKSSFLKAVFICLADTGMNERDRQRLQRRDMDLQEGVINVGRRRIKMSPRLLARMLELLGDTERDSQALIWEPFEVHNYLRYVLPKAGLEGLRIGDFRCTFAWRLEQAGWTLERIADVLGLGLEATRRLLDSVDTEAAAREKISPAFQQFTSAQLCVFMPHSGNGNRLVNDKDKGQWGGARNIKWTPEKEDEFLTLYESLLPKIKGKDPSIPEEIKAKLLLPRNTPNDVARDYAASLLGVEANDYLRTVITRARTRRKSKTRYIQVQT